MATKAGKNRYLWHGQANLSKTLLNLKTAAIELGIREQIQDIQRSKAYTTDIYQSCTESSFTPNIQNQALYEALKEDKSLGAMCQKFVMLFLVSLENGVINLDIAAKVLITNSTPNSNLDVSCTNVRSSFKTKVRRLYDISNVLSAIGLIEKVDLYNSAIRKPVFKYTGPVIDLMDFDTETPIRDSAEHSIVGMITPTKNNLRVNKRKSFTSRYVTTSRRLFNTASASVANRHERRKRKLFGIDESARSHSFSSLDVTNKTPERLDDSILQVAEIELKRLKSSETSTPESSAKLFPRYNSDSCISGQLSSGVYGNERERAAEETCDAFVTPSASHANLFHSNLTISCDKASLVAKRNLVNEYMDSAANVDENVAGALTRDTAEDRKADSSQTRNSQANHATPSSSKPTLKFLTVSALKTIPARIVNRIAPNSAAIAKGETPGDPAKTASPKFISLSNFNMKKLIPIKRIPISSPVFVSKDTIEAIKFGNSLQLVPLMNQSTVESQEKANLASNG